MHVLLRIIVDGDTPADALDNAERYAEDLVERGEFDYYSMEGRWGESVPYKIDDPHAKKLIESGMQRTRDEFDAAMRHIRFMVQKFSDEDIYEENFGTPEERKKLVDENEGIYYPSRHMFLKASGREIECFVHGAYNVWGSTIQNEGDLKKALDTENQLWVVPIDFHY